MDLLDRYRGRLSSRRLAVLVKHLPRDSAVNHDLHGESAEWSVTDYLLAAAVDHLASANWMFAMVNSGDDSDPPDPPVPVPRPGDEPEGTDSTGQAGDGTASGGGSGTAEAPSSSELVRFFS